MKNKEEQIKSITQVVQIHVWLLEQFSFECRKSKTKLITLTNHNTRKQRNEPIRIRSK